MKTRAIQTILIAFMTLLSFSVMAQERFLKVESNHSTVGFNIPIAGFTQVTGKFTDFEILLDWNDADVTASTISATIQTVSINTGIPDRDTHLASSDFFDTETYPTITFVSDAIKKIDESHIEVSGKFTMHGVTKDIVLPFEIVKQDGNTIGFASETTINRLDYGVGAEFKHTTIPDFLAKDIDIHIYFWTKKRKL